MVSGKSSTSRVSRRRGAGGRGRAVPAGLAVIAWAKGSGGLSPTTEAIGIGIGTGAGAGVGGVAATTGGSVVATGKRRSVCEPVGKPLGAVKACSQRGHLTP